MAVAAHHKQTAMIAVTSKEAGSVILTLLETSCVYQELFDPVHCFKCGIWRRLSGIHTNKTK